MRLKDYFTVPKGQKVTEKHLRRVLICSLCSILLCMSCLVGTTWAWYVVGIENKDNVINIGVPQVVATVNGYTLDGSRTLAVLQDGTNSIIFEHANAPDSLQRRNDLYVTLYTDTENSQCIVLNYGNGYKYEFSFETKANTDEVKTIRWLVTWFKPEGAVIINGNPSDMFEEDESEPEEDDETSTEESTEDRDDINPDDTGTGESDPESNDPENDDQGAGENTPDSSDPNNGDQSAGGDNSGTGNDTPDTGTDGDDTNEGSGDDSSDTETPGSDEDGSNEGNDEEDDQTPTEDESGNQGSDDTGDPDDTNNNTDDSQNTGVNEVESEEEGPDETNTGETVE